MRKLFCRLRSDLLFAVFHQGGKILISVEGAKNPGPFLCPESCALADRGQRPRAKNLMLPQVCAAVLAESPGGQIIATSRRVVSRDGRKMTIATNSPDQSGKNILTVGVYEKANEVAGMEEKIAR